MKKLIPFAISLVAATALWFILSLLVNATAPIPAIQRLFIMLGGTPNGYIQAICYVAFFYAIIELYQMRKYLRQQYTGFELNLLPVEDQLILTPDQVAEIKLSVLDIEKRGMVYLVSDFIKKACTQYRNDQSISETLQVLDVQIENTKEEMEGNLSMVRYLIAAIMSLGFIGTLIGLTNAIGNAHLAQTGEGMVILTSYLNIAFDTTLVALVLGLILNYLYNNYLGIMDNFYALSKRYIVDNLISRIYKHA